MGVAPTALIDHTLTSAEIEQFVDLFLAGGDGPLHTAIRLLHAVIQPYRNITEEDGTMRSEVIPLAETPWCLKSDYSRPFDLEVIWAEPWALHLDGPLQISIFIWRHTCEVNFWSLYWTSFLVAQNVQDTIRLVCYEIMQACHGSRVLYVPDSSYAAGMPSAPNAARLEEIEAWLQEAHGPPETSIGEIDQALRHEGRSDAYFIDTFSIVRPYPA